MAEGEAGEKTQGRGKRGEGKGRRIGLDTVTSIFCVKFVKENLIILLHSTGGNMFLNTIFLLQKIVKIIIFYSIEKTIFQKNPVIFKELYIFRKFIKIILSS